MSKETIKTAFSLAKKHGIKTNAINIIGVPGETEEMIWDTIKLNKELNPTVSGANIFYPYRGTKLGDYCFEQKLVDFELFNRFSNERRESVIKFSEEHRKALLRFQQNWDSYVYPFRIFLFIKKRLYKWFGKTIFWKIGKYLLRKVVKASPTAKK